MTVGFRLTGAQLAYFQALDEWMISYAAQNSERLFSKRYTMEQCRENFKPAWFVSRFAALQGERR
jgi:hypothetical protein